MAIGVILLFTALNILGVTNIGKIQLIMGGVLIFAFLVYIIAGLTTQNGFNWNTFMPNGRFFIGSAFWKI